MRLVSIIKNQKLNFGVVLLLGSFIASAQENSPFSRYGLGNPFPARNVVNSAMGGTTASYIDGQIVNFNNPATYSSLRYVTYDVGVALTSRNLKSVNSTNKYNSVDLVPTYVALGMPLNKAKSLGLAFGLRPVSRISYSTQVTQRKNFNGNLSDSFVYVNEGSGGLYEAFVGVGKRWGGFSIGFNTGYNFGRKENTTRTFVVDTVTTYNSNSTTTTSFGSLFLSGGLQYEADLNKTTSLRLGLTGNLKHKLNGSQDVLRETFNYLSTGATSPIDTVALTSSIDGKIEMPAMYNAGITLSNFVLDKLGNKYQKSLLTLEYETAQWSNYRFFDKADQLVNSWQFKVGAQLVPDPLSIKSYWSRVAYRAGFYIGKDAAAPDGKTLPVYAVSVGTGFPIRKWRSYDNQFTNINTLLEVGKRGNNNNNISESFFRFSIGLNLSDIWFIKRKYD
jgi:hypothetical protein